MFVQSGTSTGQGWVFFDASGCWLATPKHVVVRDAGVLVVGANGRQGFATTLNFHETEDLVLTQISGELASHCPGSSKGDVDSLPTLYRAYRNADQISFERRISDRQNDFYGIEIVPLQVVGISESGSTFTVRPSNPEEDAVVQSDSGSPVRMRGTGGGDSGYPLGLVLSVLDSDQGVQYIDVLRMDRVRAFHEQLSLKPAIPALPSARYSIAGFKGETTNSACTPRNLIASNKDCGWRAHRGADADYPAITLRLTEATEVKAIQARLKDAEALNGVAVSVRRIDGKWTDERYCSTQSLLISCNITPVKGDEVRIVINALRIELLSLEIH